MADRRQSPSSRGSSSSRSGKRRAPTTSPTSSTSRRRQPLPNVSSAMGSQNPSMAQQAPSSRLGQSEAFQLPSLPQQIRAKYQPSPSAAKIAIPRLRRDSDNPPAPAAEKHRVSHACEPCRQRKTKCSGKRPVCQHCEEMKITCLYADGKRDRTKKEIGQMAGKLEDYENLLRDLSFGASDEDQLRIRRALQKEQSREPSEAGSEARVSARVGSTGSMDMIHEDFNKSAATRATGFLGKNSEVVWMQRLSRLAASASSSDDSDSGSVQRESMRNMKGRVTGVSDSTYHCDDLSIVIADQVDPFELPPKHVADALFQAYLDTVHPVFPIVRKSTIVSQYNTFSKSPAIDTGNKWRAILNLIYAIAAKHFHLIQAEARGDERDHLIYFTRARMLGFNGDSILAHPELQQVQIAGLMAFYLAAINQVNRAWAVSGIAVRQAATLGLNLRNEDKQILSSSKEIRYRVWWALYSTERMLAVMTGRRISVIEADCSTPLPLPLDEESLAEGHGRPGVDGAPVKGRRRYPSEGSKESDPPSATSASSPKLADGVVEDMPSSSDRGFSDAMPPNDGWFFLCHTKLSIITTAVLNRMYCASASSQSWADTQHSIARFDAELERWRQSLPHVFNFIKKQREHQFIQQRMSLGFFYYSTKIIINRPCLCMVDRQIPHGSSKAKEFNRIAAVRCVHAARDFMEMLPNEPNSIGLYKVSPWWCLVHHLVQAATILMIELSFRADHMPNEADEILEAAKKVVYWLRSMAEDNIAAYRAWRLCNHFLRKLAPRIGRDATDLPDDIPGGGARFGFSATADGASPSDLPTPIAPQDYFADGPTNELPLLPEVYSTYDELFTGSAANVQSFPRQFSSMFPSNQMDSITDRPFTGQEEEWNVDGLDP